MIDRRKRRAFAAGGDIGRAEVADDVDFERRRGAQAVAELPGHPGGRPMQDRLAVQPGKDDAVARNRKARAESLDGLDMGVGHRAFELRLRASGGGRIGHDRPQPLSHGLRIGKGRGRPRLDPRLAVALDQRHVDPIHRRAADYADGEQEAGVAHSCPDWLAPGVHRTSRAPKSLAARAATKR